MTLVRARVALRAIGAVLLLIALGCAATPRVDGMLPHALSSTVDWRIVSIKKGRDLRDREVGEIAVRGGELVRLEAAGVIEIGVRERTGDAFAERWETHAAIDGIVELRAPIFATVILLPAGVRNAWLGRGGDPGYAWFDLEESVVDWGNGPLPAPFPRVAPSARIDYDAFATLDRVLADSVQRAADPVAALAQARAIRVVAGLRAVRVLRPAQGFPYFSDHDVAPSPSTPVREIDGRTAYELTPARSLTLHVEGPQLLHVWAWGRREDVDRTMQLEIHEGMRPRGTSAALVSHLASARSEPQREEADDVPLRRAVVHVPPGAHDYRLEIAEGRAWILPVVAKPVEHVEDAVEGTKSEKRLLPVGRAGCDDRLTDAICVLALSLAGEDDAKNATSPWAHAIATVPAEVRVLAESLARGGPHDPSVALEIAASQGDATALATLGAAMMESVDDGVRGAWVRGTARGTHWAVSAEADAERWTTMLFGGPSSSDASCAATVVRSWPEIDAKAVEVSAESLRGAPLIELLVSAPCDEEGPLGLEVDGASLTGVPTAAETIWRILVHGQTARVRRTDARKGHVFFVDAEAARCGGHWASMRAPKSATTSPTFTWQGTGPGVELWLKHGARGGIARVEAIDDASRAIELVVASGAGLVAVDRAGVRWTRVARVSLPAWASAGVRISGSGDVALRPIVRLPRSIAAREDVGAPSALSPEPKALDEDALAALSRDLLATEPKARGPLHRRRALVLAEAGAARAAMEDARAAKALGEVSPDGGDVVAWIHSAIRVKPPRPLTLPPDVVAYGLEPDFDPDARRCVAGVDGPRAKMVAVDAAVRASSNDAWSGSLAARALEAANDAPFDPRGAAIFARSLAGSRWKLVALPKGAARRVDRPYDPPNEGAVDAEGDLRARILTGATFEPGTYAIVTDARPVRADVGAAADAKARLDVACAPRSPAEAIDATCPLVVGVGAAPPIHPALGPDGHASVSLAGFAKKGAASALTVEIDSSEARWVALVRLVFDRGVPGAAKSGDEWVLPMRGHRARYLLGAGESLSTSIAATTIVRLDALAEPSQHPKVVATIAGRSAIVPLDGTTIMLAAPAGAQLDIRSLGGAATVLIAERVATKIPDGVDAAASTDLVESEPSSSEADSKSHAASSLLEPDSAIARWRDIADASPRPLTPTQDAFGTTTLYGTFHRGTFRAGDVKSTVLDEYFGIAAGYRRRIESIGLWAVLDGVARQRSTGAPTYGANLILYEDLDVARLRIAAWLSVFTQRIDNAQARTILSHGFVEYSARLTPTLFVLPRVGWDAFSTNIDRPPKSLLGVDDDVFNEYRRQHTTELFAQLLVWWVPYFDRILYLRPRATWDKATRSLDHVALRPGAFLAFGNLDVSVFGSTTRYPASAPLRPNPTWDVLVSTSAFYNAWFGLGSIDVSPGIGFIQRLNGQGWALFAAINISASLRRGLRDFSSLELDFPEQLGGGVPWRGPMAGGAR